MGFRGIPLFDLRRALRGNVFLLGLVSFFTDLSSEMIYPLLPVFFTGLVSPAAAAVYIGLMDGLAESISSLLKIYAGRLSDTLGKRKPLALAGYSLSSLARPFVALTTAGWQVVGLRFVDRVGKGIRTSPRDALLSDCIDCDVRGLAFSFHRLMDHVGAVGGPLLAAGFLYLALGRGLLLQKGTGTTTPAEMEALRWLFALAIIPGLAATIILWRWVREPPPMTDPGEMRKQGIPIPSSALPSRFFLFLGAVTVFTLGNSSDLFLIFYAQTRFGLGLGWVIFLWIMLHLSKILFSLPGGRFSDRVGSRPAIMIGWVIYIVIYLAMPFVSDISATCTLLFFYGAYYGMTEGAERAMVADFVPSSQRGRAYGWYHGAIGLAALPASLLFGVFWAKLGPKAAFLIGASVAFLALLLLALCLSVRGGPGKDAGKERFVIRGEREKTRPEAS